MQQMEKFKACEREMKTKAYSKEGLGLAARVDPREKQKAEICDWISNTLDTLQNQIDSMEAEQESLLAKRKRSDRLETIGMWIEQHKGHIHKLEVVLRMLQNDIEILFHGYDTYRHFQRRKESQEGVDIAR